MPNGIDFKKIKKIKSKKFKKLTILTVGRYAEKKKGFDLIPKISLIVYLEMYILNCYLFH